jgi:malate dehydrogenase (oxaloacetate-decarboxylating)(NADP+)
MKMAAARALAALAKEDVPEVVLKAYGVDSMSFGREYLIPKPFDPRVLTWEASAVAKAACETGVARKPLTDWDAYRESLERLLGPSRKVMHFVTRKARNDKPRRLVFPEGEHDSIIRAARDIIDQHIAMPVLLGRKTEILSRAHRLGIEQVDFEIVDVPNEQNEQAYAESLYQLRQRKGVTLPSALDLVRDATIYGLMMVQAGDADGFVGGMYKAYPETIRPAIQIVGLKPGVSRVSAAHLLVLKDRIFFCADTMVNIQPSAEELAEIAGLAADLARRFDTDPKIAMLAFSSFGSVPHPISQKVADAVEIVRRKNPGLVVDGEMHLDTAVVEEIVAKNYPHSRIKGDANVLVFPDLTSGNIGYKLVQRLGNADAIGPILMGMRKPVNVLQHGMTVAEIVNLAAITAVTADQQASVGRAVPAPAGKR